MDSKREDQRRMNMSNEKTMSERALGELGFKADEFGQLKAEGCSVTFNSSCGKWEVDVVLPNGSAVGFDVNTIQVRRPVQDERSGGAAMISASEIEAFAVQIAELTFEVSKANISALIGHLDLPDYDVVLTRAAQIARQRGEADLAEAEALENLERLAHATGMPAGGKPIPWLQERGLVEEIDGGGFRFKTPRPGAVTP
jgi:hypothetical protein